MKIVHLTSAHDRYDIRIFVKMCSSLAKHGWDVSLVVADGLGDEEKNGVKIYDAGARSSGRLKRMTTAVSNVYHLAIKLDSDVYHLHDPELLFIGIFLKLRGKKVIFDAHEDLPKQLLGKPYLNGLTKIILSKVFYLIEFIFCRFFDVILTATPIIAEKFLKINPKTLDINNFPILGELKVDADWSQRKNEICYIGGIAKIRGVREMIQSLEYIQSPTCLNLVGDFSESGMEAELSKTPGWKKVKFYGNVDRKKLAEIMGAVKCGLVLFHPLPNHTDAQPNKMFEYMSAGIPIITSNFPLWREIVEGNTCGICADPLDPKAIAKAIDNLLTNDTLAKEMGQNGFNAVIGKYNWQNEEKKLLNIYSELELK